ncbi:hypothetical protein C9F11_43760 (plasmid) [Streptomyces sp. YIM 121038]|uniref:transposase n=1 Tax=Streptomyces sp. YIM 121038 TaxID=2136401 RepID=UPI00111023F4|nr:transposase [Streptomyces sp. YIM 121038]QCX82330.1 hypothetical protein C9F11_43760 [Streptomyces sp. YIM 121038]
MPCSTASSTFPPAWAAGDEHRELTGVPDETAFTTKPELAARMLTRLRRLGCRARWVAADEVYGGQALRRRLRELGYDYAVGVRTTHTVTTDDGNRVAVTTLVPKAAWQRVRTGSGTKGDRHYDWACISVKNDDAPTSGKPDHGESVILVRRHRYPANSPIATATPAVPSPWPPWCMSSPAGGGPRRPSRPPRPSPASTRAR